jgi:hypothetical protein
MRARKTLALQQRDPPSLAGQHGGGGTATRTTANNDDVDRTFRLSWHHVSLLDAEVTIPGHLLCPSYDPHSQPSFWPGRRGDKNDRRRLHKYIDMSE